MKSIYLKIFFILLSFHSHAQKQCNTWYFGSSIGLNFNTNPVSVLYDAAMNSIEGSSTISDNNGKLLFYTNGTRINNRNHEIMKNGSSLFGDLSSTCNSVIVPIPDNDSLYYLFTVGAANKAFQGFRYNIINMKRDEGLGEVIEKNVQINAEFDEIYEKLAAVRHCNMRDVWVTIKKWNSDEYHTYLVTPAGLSQSPVISHTGYVLNGYANNSLGSLKFSPDGKMLAAVHSFERDVIELMNFDNQTGVLSSSVVFKPQNVAFSPSYSCSYGLEFSPNGKLVYVSAANGVSQPTILYQFDISSMDVNTIVASKQVIAQALPLTAGALQLGPDQKIYFSMWKDSALSVIENPNVAGPGCNFVLHKIFISGNTNNPPVQFGFPNFISSDLVPEFAPYDFTNSINCATSEVSFTLSKITGIDSVLWDFGDGNQSRLLNPIHRYTATGEKLVSVIIYKTDCLGTSQTIKHTLLITDPDHKILPDDAQLCTIDKFKITPSKTGTSYLWNTGSNAPFIEVSNPGLYWLQMQVNGCTVRDSINITAITPPTINIGKDTSICTYDPIMLFAGVGATSYLWSTGETTDRIAVTTPGAYWVEVNVQNCKVYDTININVGDCLLYFPNAFTPNGDGVNDFFRLSAPFVTKFYQWSIFNRYGECIFQTSDAGARWDGNFKGKKQPMGAYTWQLVYKNKYGFFEKTRGTVLLIR